MFSLGENIQGHAAGGAPGYQIARYWGEPRSRPAPGADSATDRWIQPLDISAPLLGVVRRLRSAAAPQTAGREVAQQPVDDRGVVDAFFQQTARLGAPGRLDLEQGLDGLPRPILVSGGGGGECLRGQSDRVG